jgi:hypothetical protein
LQNLSSSVIKAQIDTSKSDKRDFQSPDRGAGNGSERFRKVTMAMISSYGPTCEDRKITRKMRNEVGGVVDLRQELNPINTYKIKKAHKFGNNLNKEVNPKTKLEGARIIQYWWRKLKEQKIIRYKIIKITKIQTYIRRYLVRKRIISIRIIDTLENIFDNHDRDKILKFFKYLKEGKAKNKLMNLINNVNKKNNKKKILKYFFKYKFISDFLKKKINFQTSTIDFQISNSKNTEVDNKREVQEETKITEITEEMYIKYIKEKYLNNNKSEHISQLSIDKKERKPYEIEKKDKYEVQRIKKELKDEETGIEKEKVFDNRENNDNLRLLNLGYRSRNEDNANIKNIHLPIENTFPEENAENNFYLEIMNKTQEKNSLNKLSENLPINSPSKIGLQKLLKGDRNALNSFKYINNINNTKMRKSPNSEYETRRNNFKNTHNIITTKPKEIKSATSINFYNNNNINQNNKDKKFGSIIENLFENNLEDFFNDFVGNTDVNSFSPLLPGIYQEDKNKKNKVNIVHIPAISHSQRNIKKEYSRDALKRIEALRKIKYENNENIYNKNKMNRSNENVMDNMFGRTKLSKKIMKAFEGFNM